MAMCYFKLDDNLAGAYFLEQAKALMNRRVNIKISTFTESLESSKKHELFTIPKKIIFLPSDSTFMSQEKLDILYNKDNPVKKKANTLKLGKQIGKIFKNTQSTRSSAPVTNNTKPSFDPNIP
ncbi:hypothetical protein BB561_005377 [Smittium simulii]|uniref:Uncharacterized protein n=1 Tax=Smittium simulii TaxID=133385 RepID=A0A2T9YAN8_9FUNG|nr:hypothetical protein BB561_005377 [Smittium simulii]